MTRISAVALVLLAIQTSVFGDTPRRVQIQVVDESGKPVSGATVDARYLETVSQDGKDYPVPMELAQSQDTDSNGRCELKLKEVQWTLAGLSAFRRELTTDEAEKLLDNAPKDRQEREAHERAVYERMKRFSTSFALLDPKLDNGTPVTLQLAKAVRITGRVRADGQPLAKANVSIYSQASPIDKLFPRTAPEITDREGRIDYYSVPGDLDRARIVMELEKEYRVLTLTDITSTPTSAGREFAFNTNWKDYTIKQRLRENPQRN